MIKLVKENGTTYAPVKDLYLFKDNPRDVEAKDFERLKEQLKLGEHSPLLITTEGEVLGGNTRLRAYQELGKKEAKVVVVEIVESSEGVHIVVDGKKSERVFDTVNQAKIELALSHNDAIGTNNELKLAELLTVNKINSEIYSVNTQITPIDTILEKLGPGEENFPDANQEVNPNDLLDEDSHECPKCGFEFNCDKKESNL